MAQRSTRRNNVIAGLFLVASLALAVAMSVVISDARERLTPTSTYYVRFSVSEGALGLKPGSPVLLAGLQVGRVTEVTIARRPIDPSGPPGVQVPTGVDVQIKIRKDLLLYEDAMAMLQIPLLGTLSVLNIASIGDGTTVEHPQGLGPLLEPGERLTGRIAPPAFLAQAGYGPEEVNQVRAIIATAADVMDRVDRVTSAVEQQFTPSLATIRTAAEDVQAITGDLRARTPEWRAGVEAVLADAGAAAERLPAIAESADAGVREARDVIAGVRATLDENRPRVDRTLQHVEAVAADVRERTVPLANETLENARAGSADFRAVAADVGDLLRRQVPSLERMLANFRLAADQFKLTSVEVRRNPWRLLYRPKTKELENELLYDATRAYAEAVSDLRAASEALQALSQPGAPERPNTERIRAMAERIQRAFDAYKQAEQTLLDRIAEGAG